MERVVNVESVSCPPYSSRERHALDTRATRLEAARLEATRLEATRADFDLGFRFDSGEFSCWRRGLREARELIANTK